MPGEKTRWAKGVSGNPGGRPAMHKDIREAAQRHCPAAIEALAEIVRNTKESASARVSAASVIFDRAYGKAGQAVNANITTKRPSDMTREELDAKIAELMAEEAAEEEAPEPELN